MNIKKTQANEKIIIYLNWLNVNDKINYLSHKNIIWKNKFFVLLHIISEKSIWKKAYQTLIRFICIFFKFVINE